MITKAAFYDVVRSRLLHVITESQVEGIDLILNYWESKANNAAWFTASAPFAFLAYILATVYHETAHTFQPIREFGGSHARYAPYYGRGFVQLTWRIAYVVWSKLLGVDLVASPDRAMEPNLALEILFRGMMEGRFTGHRLADYVEGELYDYKNARHIVNPGEFSETWQAKYGDTPALIAGYAMVFHAAIGAGLAAPDPLNPAATISTTMLASPTTGM